MRTAGIVAAVALLFTSWSARADSAKAWSAARLGLPAEAKVVFGVDLAAIQKTQLFATLWSKLLEKEDVAKTLGVMKDTCKIDPLAVVQGIVVAMSDDQQDGAGYVAITGLDKARLSSCLQKAVQSISEKTAKVSIKQDGNITQVSDGKDSMFLGWVSKDVVVVPLHAQDKDAVVKWMSGKGALAKTGVGKTIAKVNTSAPLWAAGEASKEIEPGMVIKGGYGALTFSKGNLDADVHATMASPAQAATMASTTSKQLDQAKQGALVPPAVATVLKAITINAANDEVVVKASVLEKDLLSALTIALGAL